ncbi:hypothetical protein D3C71_817450 [compost metagenome]
MLRVLRIECYTPDLRRLLQRFHDILEMHEAQPTVDIRLAIPSLETGAQRCQRFRIGTQTVRAELQQIRHDLRSLIHLIVHHHVLQIRRCQRAGLG